MGKAVVTTAVTARAQKREATARRRATEEARRRVTVLVGAAVDAMLEDWHAWPRDATCPRSVQLRACTFTKGFRCTPGCKCATQPRKLTGEAVEHAELAYTLVRAHARSSGWVVVATDRSTAGSATSGLCVKDSGGAPVGSFDLVIKDAAEALLVADVQAKTRKRENAKREEREEREECENAPPLT